MAFSTQNRKNEMRPLPMRITQLQFDRLDAARLRDGMAMQEHVRRALDLYLDKIERVAAQPAPPALSGRAEQLPNDAPADMVGAVAQTARELLARDAERREAPRVRQR